MLTGTPAILMLGTRCVSMARGSVYGAVVCLEEAAWSAQCRSRHWGARHCVGQGVVCLAFPQLMCTELSSTVAWQFYAAVKALTHLCPLRWDGHDTSPHLAHSSDHLICKALSTVPPF